MAAIAVLSYGVRFSEPTGDGRPDVFFRWSTALGTFVLDGLLLLFMLLIARGLPMKEVLALRRPPSWPDAGRVALAALGATWLTSLVIEQLIGHAGREQAVPQYFDAARLDAFAANVVAIALFVPIVEETMCRGVGFYLLEPWGQRVAIGVSALAFAVAHGAVLDLPWVLVTGLGLGYLRARSGSLYPCVALHATVNGVALLASAALSVSPPG